MGYVLGIAMEPPLKLVALALAWHANKDGTNAFPSKALLAEETGLGERTVQRHLARLVAIDVVQIQARAGGHRPTTYRFALTADRPSVTSLADHQGSHLRTRGANSGFQGSHSRGSLTVEPSYEKNPSTVSPPPVDKSTMTTDEIRRGLEEALPGLAAFRLTNQSTRRSR